jgi:hypothetical protein
MIYLFILLMAPQFLFANDKSLYSACPNVTEDAKVILTSIKSLQDELRKSPECQSVAAKITTVSEVFNSKSYKSVLETLNAGKIPHLEVEEINSLSKMINEATYALSDTVAQLSNGSNNCLPQTNKASFLSTLSGITKDLSGVIGNVAGPYGAAISMGGNLISGVISGIDKLFKQNKVYDFKKPEEELLFMNQFCAYTQSQQDIHDFLELENKEKELLGLEEMYLKDTKIKELVQNCPECNAYKIAWETNEEAQKIIDRIREDAQIVNSNINPTHQVSFTRCAEINRAFYSDHSDFAQLVTLFSNYSNPMMSPSDTKQLTDLTSAMKNMRNIYPSYETCISQEDSLNISIKFNNFMRDEVLRLTDTTLRQQMNTFQFLANKKYRDPNGDYIASSLDRAKWANTERQKVIRKIKEPNYEHSKQVVLKANQHLANRILNVLLPQYLKFRFKDNKKNINTFSKSFVKFRNQELEYFNSLLAQDAKSVEDLTVILKEEQNSEVARYFASSYHQLFMNSKLTILKVSNNMKYCDYLLYSKSMTKANRSICLDGIQEITNEMNNISYLKIDLDAIGEFEQWASKNLRIQSSSVMDYIDCIEDWNIRGDARWELINPDL